MCAARRPFNGWTHNSSVTCGGGHFGGTARKGSGGLNRSTLSDTALVTGRLVAKPLKRTVRPSSRICFYASDVKIRRHVRIKEEANPFDVRWEEYFEHRLTERMKATFRGREQLNYLWREQGGQCPVCSAFITDQTGWHNHHIQPRVLGGADTSENRVLLHPDCHRKVHSLGLTVEKPRPVKAGR